MAERRLGVLMKDEIFENQLRDEIIGLPLTDMWRAGLQVFEFGEQVEGLSRKGEVYYASQKRIHVICPWRIIKENTLILGSGDYLEQESKISETHDYSTFFEELEAGRLIVRDINYHEFNDLEIIFDNNYKLQLFLVGARLSDYWRFINSTAEHDIVAYPDKLDNL